MICISSAVGKPHLPGIVVDRQKARLGGNPQAKTPRQRRRNKKILDIFANLKYTGVIQH